MKIELTRNEGLKVIEALREVALSHGWEEDELEESDVLAEYGAVVDAACKAMGIEFSVNPNPNESEEDYEEDYDEDEDEDEEEEDEEDEEEDEDTTVYSLTPKGYFVLAMLDSGMAWETACEIADAVFIQKDKDEDE